MSKRAGSSPMPSFTSFAAVGSVGSVGLSLSDSGVLRRRRLGHVDDDSGVIRRRLGHVDDDSGVLRRRLDDNNVRSLLDDWVLMDVRDDEIGGKLLCRLGQQRHLDCMLYCQICRICIVFLFFYFFLFSIRTESTQPCDRITFRVRALDIGVQSLVLVTDTVGRADSHDGQVQHEAVAEIVAFVD